MTKHTDRFNCLIVLIYQIKIHENIKIPIT